MTYRIPKSTIVGISDFPAAATAFAAEATAWKRHMKKVGVDPEYAPYPAPTAHEIVQAAVRFDDASGTFVPDFEVFDDGPDAETILRMKKNDHLVAVNVLEMQARHAIVPPGKERWLNLREGDVKVADGKRAAEYCDKHRKYEPKGVVQKVKDAILGEEAPDLTPEGIEAHVCETRRADDTAFLEERKKQSEKFEAINRHAAQLHHDIEDLTEADIDGWKPAPFPTNEG